MLTTKNRAATAQDDILAGVNNPGFAGGSVELYTGVAPADVVTPATGTLLANCVIGDFSGAAFAPTNTTTLVAVGNKGTNPYFAQDTNPPASGTIGYWRLYDYLGTAVGQGTVGLVSSGAEIEFNTLSVIAGVLVQITDMQVTILNIY